MRMTLGKVHDPRIRARIARKRNAASKEAVNGKRIARPRTPCGTAKPCNEADRTLSSRPCPSARLVQPSRLPTSTIAAKEEEPATNDDNRGIWRRTRFELVKKKAEREATAIAGRRTEAMVLLASVESVRVVMKFPSAKFDWEAGSSKLTATS